MDTISNTVWQRKGSSIIFNEDSLAPFVKDGAVIPLREALSWMKAFPSVPPVDGKTIVVCGLETMIETLPEGDIHDFLTRRVRPLIMALQHRWPDCAMVFGFTSHAKAFEESLMQEEVLFKRRDRISVRLSEGLWDGSATLNMKRIVDSEREPGQEVTIGYYVAWIS